MCALSSAQSYALLQHIFLHHIGRLEIYFSSFDPYITTLLIQLSNIQMVIDMVKI